MLNLFPIQFLSPLAYLLLRLTIGVFLARYGSKRLFGESASLRMRTLGTLELIVGALYIIGLYTQAAAIAGIAIGTTMLVTYSREHCLHTISRSTAVFIIMVSLSLLITGSGPLAFDLPI